MVLRCRLIPPPTADFGSHLNQLETIFFFSSKGLSLSLVFVVGSIYSITQSNYILFCFFCFWITCLPFWRFLFFFYVYFPSLEAYFCLWKKQGFFLSEDTRNISKFSSLINSNFCEVKYMFLGYVAIGSVFWMNLTYLLCDYTMYLGPLWVSDAALLDQSLTLLITYLHFLPHLSTVLPWWFQKLLGLHNPCQDHMEMWTG